MADNASKLAELNKKIEELEKAYASTAKGLETFKDEKAKFNVPAQKSGDDDEGLTQVNNSIDMATGILESLRKTINNLLEEMTKLERQSKGGSRRRRPSRKYKKSKRVLRRKSRSTRRR